MFTTGRIAFTITFMVLFAGVMIWAYRKDLKQIKKWFPRPWAILLGLLMIFFVYYFFARLI